MRRMLAILAAVALLAAACGNDSVSTDSPDDTAPPDDVEAPPLDEFDEATPELVEPRPGMADVRRSAFESATSIDDGRVLAIRYWSGVEPCDVLDRVDVEESATEVVVTLQIGRDPEVGEDVACILIAQLYETHVTLAEPLGDRTVIDAVRGTAAEAEEVAV
jgi:hypothetical protein